MVVGFGKTQARVDEYFALKKIEADWASDLKKCIEIFHVVCLESYYSETINQMHPDTSFRNGSGASMKWSKTRNSLGGINSCIKCTRILILTIT